MTNSWCNRPYHEGDEHGILALRRAAFGNLDPVRLLMSTWRWQFRDNPAGAPFIRLAECRGRVVAQYAVIPMRVSVDGTERTLAFSCDTMTHPAFQRRGLFSLLAGAVYRDMEEQAGIRGVFGFPNRASMPGFVKNLGWRPIASLPPWVTPANPAGALFPPGAGFREKGRDLALSPLSGFGPCFDDLWARHRPEKGVALVRDSRYLSWRYPAFPDFGYRSFSVTEQGETRGFLVLRPIKIKGIPILAIVDAFPLNILSPGLLGLLRKMAAKARATAITALFAPADYRKARHLGFFPAPKKISPKTFELAGRFYPDEPESITSADGWRVSFGDTDIV